MEEDWESWRMEGNTVVVPDKEAEVEVAEEAVEMGLQYCQVSVFLGFHQFYSEFNLSFL